jgi:hypothetical protein
MKVKIFKYGADCYNFDFDMYDNIQFFEAGDSWWEVNEDEYNNLKEAIENANKERRYLDDRGHRQYCGPEYSVWDSVRDSVGILLGFCWDFLFGNLLGNLLGILFGILFGILLGILLGILSGNLLRNLF